MKLIDMVEMVLGKNTGALHVDDIAIFLTDEFPHIQEDLDDLPQKISSALSVDVKRKGSKFSKPRNKSGGFKRGMYRLKKKVAAQVLKSPTPPKVSTQFTGCAGEHAVLSELLFWGFNSSIMAVDDGIDVVASKDNSYFHIQVKTANSQADGGYQFGVSRDRFNAKHTNTTFYIIVLRRMLNGRNMNDFMIMPSSDVKRLVDSDHVKGKDTLSFKIIPNEGGKFFLNNTEDVTRCINCWDAIV